MAKIWVNRANSFKMAEKFDIAYYFNMGASERLETMQLLREIYFNVKRVPRKKRKLQKVAKAVQFRA